MTLLPEALIYFTLEAIADIICCKISFQFRPLTASIGACSSSEQKYCSFDSITCASTVNVACIVVQNPPVWNLKRVLLSSSFLFDRSSTLNTLFCRLLLCPESLYIFCFIYASYFPPASVFLHDALRIHIHNHVHFTSVMEIRMCLMSYT